MHGGDIYRNKINHDFSVNINPLGPGKEILQALMDSLLTHVQEYPDPDSEELRNLLRKKLSFPDAEIVFGNGASELIGAVVRAFKAEKALVPSPGFSGYETAVKAAGTEVFYYNLLESDGFAFVKKTVEQVRAALEKNGCRMVFLTNPSNPCGKLTNLNFVFELAELCRENGAVLVVDECFMALTGKEEAFSAVKFLGEFENLVILRSFTKTFAIPGIRLGYCLLKEKKTAAAVKEQTAEWSVSTLAQRAGAQALKDLSTVYQAVNLIEKEKIFLIEELKALGFKVFESDVNYLLFIVPDGFQNLKERLIEKGILIRDCSDYNGLKQGFYRIAVKQHEENVILVNAIKDIGKR